MCAHLGTAPERTVHVGDSVLSDVEGAHAAGLVAVWLDRHGDAWPPPPGVHRITSLAELPDLLAALARG
jgi:putative hydrolase of the HAD superfamily